MWKANVRNPAQDKPLTKGEIEKLKKSGSHPHEVKEKDGGGKSDLYKDPKTGDIYIKPKGGKGPAEPTGFNIKDL